jgi:hypothetical protein
MENLYFAVIPAPAYCLQGQAPAGIHWHQVFRDSRFRGSDSIHAFSDTLAGGDPLAQFAAGFLLPQR